MISNKDRSGWFGASDTTFICGNYETQTFLDWWFVKLGLLKNDFTNKYMQTGSAYEHKIIDLIAKTQNKCLKKDRQIKIRKLRLRVNLDAETLNQVVEIKTTNKEVKSVPKNYLQQVQVQMFASKKHKAVIAFYLVDNNYYKNFFLELEEQRLTIIPINYDLNFINNDYLPRLKYLAHCLTKKLIPTNIGLEQYLKQKENE